jgi:hypothetical protein
MPPSDTVRFRLLRNDAEPPAPDGSAAAFGIQDSRGQLHPPVARPDGMLVFDFDLQVKDGPDPDRPVFTGPFASGPRDERFVYLAWPRLDGQGYVNRAKFRLIDITWAQVRAAQASNRPLEYDASNARAGGGRVAVEWRLGEP